MDHDDTAPAPARLRDAVGTDPARRLRDAVEPLAMHGVWSESVHAALSGYGVEHFEGYVLGRSSSLGDPPAALVTATFGAFAPALIERVYAEARSKIGREVLVAARDAAAAASLRGVLSGEVSDDEARDVVETIEGAAGAISGAGRPLFAALRSLPELGDVFGRLWRACDLVREHRGDTHLAAVVAAGLGPCEMNILTELWLGYPLGEYSGTRQWPEDDTRAAVASLTAAGHLDGDRLTDSGRALRERVERATDTGQRDLVAAFGDRLDPLIGTLDRWSARCVEAGAFPADPRKRAAG